MKRVITKVCRLSPSVNSYFLLYDISVPFRILFYWTMVNPWQFSRKTNLWLFILNMTFRIKKPQSPINRSYSRYIHWHTSKRLEQYSPSWLIFIGRLKTKPWTHWKFIFSIIVNVFLSSTPSATVYMPWSLNVATSNITSFLTIE